MGLKRLIRGVAARAEKALGREKKRAAREHEAHARIVVAEAARRAAERDCGTCGSCGGDPWCAWRQGVLGDEHRPDLLGVVITGRVLPKTGADGVVTFAPVFVFQPVRDGILELPEVQRLIEVFRGQHDVLPTAVGGGASVADLLPRLEPGAVEAGAAE